MEYNAVGGGISCGPQLSRIAGFPLCSLEKCIAREITSFFFPGLFAELRKATIRFVVSVRPSVRPYGTTPLPLDGFPLKIYI